MSEFSKEIGFDVRQRGRGFQSTLMSGRQERTKDNTHTGAEYTRLGPRLMKSAQMTSFVNQNMLIEEY